MLVGEIVIPVTGIGAAVTVILLVAAKLPSEVLTVIAAVPGELPAITSPEADTEATPGALLVQTTLLSSASTGRTVSISCVVSPTIKVAVAGLSCTEVTLTGPGVSGPGQERRKKAAITQSPSSIYFFIT
jgi:hypothetical protein